MRIENLRKETKGENARVAATVIWENCDRPTQVVYFDTSEEFSRDLTCDPHAFLVGCLMPAMRHGEQRIAIDEDICPELRIGLETAMDWICHWYGAPRKPVLIEAQIRVHACPSRQRMERAGSFLSGGVDSIATLQANRLAFSSQHPRSIRDCLFVYGFDIGGSLRSGDEIETLRAFLGLGVDVGAARCEQSSSQSSRISEALMTMFNSG